MKQKVMHKASGEILPKLVSSKPTIPYINIVTFKLFEEVTAKITVIYQMTTPNRNFISYIKFPYDYMLDK